VPVRPRERIVTIEVVSEVCAPPEVVWASVASMRGVNEELRPLVRMTYPPGCDRLAAAGAVMAGFRSWVLLLGFIPIDRHSFGFEAIVDGAGFTERSESWMNRSWCHVREIAPGGANDRAFVRDTLRIEPRLGLLAPVLHRGVGVVFRHRHRRLKRRFSGQP
jgi:ligand-binding SRPBCC domain-containing protein